MVNVEAGSSIGGEADWLRLSRRSGRIAQPFLLRPLRAALEASSGSVREGMIEDLERRLMLVEEELEVVVARSIADGDRYQFVVQ
jgi:hypothetical protein